MEPVCSGTSTSSLYVCHVGTLVQVGHQEKREIRGIFRHRTRHKAISQSRCPSPRGLWNVGSRPLHAEDTGCGAVTDASHRNLLPTTSAFSRTRVRTLTQGDQEAKYAPTEQIFGATGTAQKLLQVQRLAKPSTVHLWVPIYPGEGPGPRHLSWVEFPPARGTWRDIQGLVGGINMSFFSNHTISRRHPGVAAGAGPHTRQEPGTENTEQRPPAPTLIPHTRRPWGRSRGCLVLAGTFRQQVPSSSGVRAPGMVRRDRACRSESCPHTLSPSFYTIY